MRKCTSCGEEKPYEMFTKHSQCKGKIDSECKECKRVRFRKWYSENGSRYNNENRNRRTEQHRKYSQSDKGKVVSTKKSKRMREKYPEKNKARVKLRYEVKMGRVIKLPCQICGESKSNAHHPDYSKPLEVVWLCNKHHREVHNNKC